MEKLLRYGCKDDISLRHYEVDSLLLKSTI